MRKQALTVAVMAAVLVSTGMARAQEATWVHVRVDEAEGAQVSVNLPTSLVEVALDVAGKEALEGDHLRWDPHGEVTLDDVRRIWRELRDAGDAEFVDVREGDEHVRVFRRGDRVFVHVDEGETEKVRVEMPSAIVDELLGTEGDQLDLRAAVRALARSGRQELVQIRDAGTTIRIWVDDSNAQGT